MKPDPPGMWRLPKQYPAVPAITCPPRPALCTSLIRPPVPVVAPLKGATPRVEKKQHFALLPKKGKGV